MPFLRDDDPRLKDVAAKIYALNKRMNLPFERYTAETVMVYRKLMKTHLLILVNFRLLKKSWFGLVGLLYRHSNVVFCRQELERSSSIIARKICHSSVKKVSEPLVLNFQIFSFRTIPIFFRTGFLRWIVHSETCRYSYSDSGPIGYAVHIDHDLLMVFEIQPTKAGIFWTQKLTTLIHPVQSSSDNRQSKTGSWKSSKVQ